MSVHHGPSLTKHNVFFLFQEGKREDIKKRRNKEKKKKSYGVQKLPKTHKNTPCVNTRKCGIAVDLDPRLGMAHGTARVDTANYEYALRQHYQASHGNLGYSRCKREYIL